MPKIRKKTKKNPTAPAFQKNPGGPRRFMRLFWLFVLYYVWHSTLFTFIFYKQVGNDYPYNEQNEP